MHPYKDKAKNGKQLAKKRGYADGGAVSDRDREFMEKMNPMEGEAQKSPPDPMGYNKPVPRPLPKGAVSDKEKEVMGRKTGGKVNKKGC